MYITKISKNICNIVQYHEQVLFVTLTFNINNKILINNKQKDFNTNLNE